MKKIVENGRGITLIALIITIIILLILAGITLNIVINGGLIEQAKNATDKYKQAEVQEQNSLNELAEKIDNMNKTANAGDVIKQEGSIKYTADGKGNVIPVPEGFSYAGEGTKETGFVIKNDIDENEFVWIPVKDMPYKYDRYAFTREEWTYRQILGEKDEKTNSYKIIRADLPSYYYTETLLEDERISVEIYGGYYIARYEAGILTQRKSATEQVTVKPIFRKTGDTVVHVYNYVTKAQAQQLSENLYNKTQNNVTSKLCSSYAWDTALKFIETKNEGWSTNSIGGNYDISSNGTGELKPTGYHSVNNIYDMGGNVWEITNENYSNNSTPYVARRCNI